MPRAYYNEIEPAAVHVLRVLIDENIIAPGDVDDRSIKEVRPSDLIGYTQCHFFAGGGLWSVALRLAGWPDERPVWTGSCPRQPFSQAGKGLGRDDPRHLWPDFHRLIAGARPDVVFGEQVAGAAGYDWFDGVSADLEREGYAAEAFDIPAAAVDAPHIRQRLYWCAMVDAARVSKRKSNKDVRPVARQDARFGYSGNSGGHRTGGMADADGSGHRRRPETSQRESNERIATEWLGGGMGDSKSERWGERRPEYEIRSGRAASSGASGGDMGNPDGAGLSQRQSECGDDGAKFAAVIGTSRNGSFWSDHEWRTGADGKARRVKPGVCLLVDGVLGRMGLLRIAGNAIVPQLAAEFIKAFMESEQ